MAGPRAATLKVAINPFAHVENLAGARDAFGPLSDAIIAYVRDAHVSAINVVFCPMARKYWLQKGDTVANPYYGKSMADCGRIVHPQPGVSP